MEGVLLGAFCERGGAELTRCLELWSYPDTTVNVVVNRFGADGEEEYCFPCGIHHLIRVLEFKSFRAENEFGNVTLERDDENVKAVFALTEDGAGWRHTVPVEPFVSALSQIAPEAAYLSGVLAERRTYLDVPPLDDRFLT